LGGFLLVFWGVFCWVFFFFFAENLSNWNQCYSYSALKVISYKFILLRTKYPTFDSKRKHC
jgi:hypothetical protein